jgi:5'-3' exonuclease
MGMPYKDVYVEAHDLSMGIAYIDKVLLGFKEQFDARQLVLVLGDPNNNYRKGLNKLYKSHRSSKPLMYDMVLKHLVDNYTTVMLPNLEADDVARIIYEDDDTYKGNKIIVTIDKDFYSVPCTLYRDNIKDREIVTVSDVDARVNEYVQVIMGDKTDGYSGIPMYGEAKARAFVTEDTTLEDIKQLYLDNKCTEDDFVLNYNMAHILGFKDYNFRLMEPIVLEKEVVICQ